MSDSALSVHDRLLVENIANHFDTATVDGAIIDLGFGGVRVGCHVFETGVFGSFRTASLFFQLSGGRLGERPIFASTSGYGGTDEEAIRVGACNWGCVFGPLLRSALAGGELGEATRFETTLHGEIFDGFVLPRNASSASSSIA